MALVPTIRVRVQVVLRWPSAQVRLLTWDKPGVSELQIGPLFSVAERYASATKRYVGVTGRYTNLHERCGPLRERYGPLRSVKRALRP